MAVEMSTKFLQVSAYQLLFYDILFQLLAGKMYHQNENEKGKLLGYQQLKVE